MTYGYIFLFLILVLCTSTSKVFALEEEVMSNKHDQTPWFSTLPFDQSKLPSAYHWMENIQSSTKLSSLAIPGTHDTCTDAFHKKTPIDKVLIEKYSKTQAWPLKDQLKAGIRYIDIRAGSDGNIYHGMYKTKSTFKGVLETVSAFLSQNPSEGIIMRIKLIIKKKCKTQMCIDDNIIKVLDHYYSLLYLKDAIPLLGDIRGKIFLITDFTYKGAMQWYSALIAIQDKYKMIGEPKHEIKKKKAHILEYINRGKAKKEFIINHCSGAGAPLITIKGVAEKTNKVPYEENGFSGIIPMDYPGEELIQHLLNQNKEFEIKKGNKSNKHVNKDLFGINTIYDSLLYY